MKLPDTIRAYTADLRHRFRGKTWHAGNPGPPLDDLDLAADIIDSLPKAEDGSVIWKGCWLALSDGTIWRHESDRRLSFGVDSGGTVTEVNYTTADPDPYTGDFDGVQWPVPTVLSTHRTREEAEAAAAQRLVEDAARSIGGEPIPDTPGGFVFPGSAKLLDELGPWKHVTIDPTERPATVEEIDEAIEAAAKRAGGEG